MTWVITNPLPDPILSVNSTNAQMFAAGITSAEGQINTPLTHGPIEPGQTARIRETIIIPQNLLTRILQAGDRTIGVERFFQVEVAPGQFVTTEGQLQINITGSLGAGLQINRIDLRFQNEAVQIIVPQRHPPEVRADISYTGTGLFRAVWEVADPRSTAGGGSPIFQVLRQDRIRLGVGGVKRVKGPQLPAQLTGLHVVRFRVLDGPLAGQAPVVRYFVKRAAPEEEDWWKRYIRPHEEGEGLVRVPVEPEEEEPVIEDVTEPDDVDDQVVEESPAEGDGNGDGPVPPSGPDGSGDTPAEEPEGDALAEEEPAEDSSAGEETAEADPEAEDETTDDGDGDGGEQPEN